VNADPSATIGGGGGGVGDVGTTFNCDGSGVPCNWVPRLGWVPAGSQAGPYSVNNYDTVGIRNGLESEFPCIAALLKTTLPNVNYIAQLTGKDIFNDDSMYIHLTFDTSTTNTQMGQPSGTTSDISAPFVDGNGITSYHGIIKLNPYYLRHGTKEYIISTILHETMHAIFRVRWAQYQSWLTYHDTQYDSGFLKQHFPIYWYKIMNQTVPLNELQDHEIMASDYVNKFSSIMRQLYNPAAPTAIRDTVIKAIGYCGLDSTTAWKMLPSLGIDTCKYKAIKVTAEQSLIGTFNTSGCPNFTTHYADSLKMRPGSCN
jgi:hypothetical protein